MHSKKFLTGDGRSREDESKQYGSGGVMQARRFMICATFNAPADAFNNLTQALLLGKGTEDPFLNITSNYRFCGYDILPGYYCFDIYKG